ncbi:hypothetical protein CLU79DRAFT_720510 [Phycomyces nitens]|nr:hypothetical protein CLU79DRAFT_720510 [Phycomyces nitens]
MSCPRTRRNAVSGNDNKFPTSCDTSIESTGHHRSGHGSWSNFTPHIASKWFSRIRHRSCSSGSGSVGQKKPEDKNLFEWNDFERHFEIAQAEIAYAIESHGSIYYEEDHATAQTAVNACVDRYLSLQQEHIDTTPADARWAGGLLRLRAQLNHLPDP